MRSFNAAYAGLATGLLALEVLIARFAHDRFIRPYAGDFLVPILLYCLVQSAGRRPVGRVLAAVLLVSYLVEMGQYFHLVARLGLAHSRGARLVLGSAFSWADMLAYTLGALLVLGMERGLERLLGQYTFFCYPRVGASPPSPLSEKERGSRLCANASRR